VQRSDAASIEPFFVPWCVVVYCMILITFNFHDTQTR